MYDAGSIHSQAEQWVPLGSALACRRLEVLLLQQEAVHH